MNIQQNSQINEKKKATAAICDMELTYADALLDQVDTAQQEVQDIQSDIALLQTMENALCLISENMARIRRLAQEMLKPNTSKSEMNLASDEIRNLMMINMLIAEDTEFNGYLLFKDDVINMCSDIGELTLTTAKIPYVRGVENGDFQVILDSLDGVAHMINQQYQHINTVMLTLLDSYKQVRCEIDLLLKAYPSQNNQQS